MNKDLAIVDAPRQTVLLSTEQLRYIANTEFVPKDKRGNLPAILACVAASRELGIGDMFGINNINVIDGSVSYSAELCTHLVRRAGHSLKFKWGKESCTVYGRRRDNGDDVEFTFTMDMARRVQVRAKGGGSKPLAEKDNWKNYPEAMLAARAATQVCRVLFSDCFAGGTYTADELGSEEIVEAAPLEEPDGHGAQGEPATPQRENWVHETPAGSSSGEPITDADELYTWAIAQGFNQGMLKAEKFALFPDSKDRHLTADEVAQLHAALVAKLGQESLPV